MIEITENTLKSCVKGDRKVMEELYRLMYPPMIKTALGFVCNELDARSIYNNAMLKVFRQLNTLKGNEGAFYSWCRKIVVNESLDFLKSSLAKKSFEQLDLAKHQNKADLIDFDFEENDSIFNSLQQLPQTSRAVFCLFALEGYSHQEISEKLDISVANSKWHLYSAREKLKKILFNTTKNIKQ
jgi:RNA polymerase sigma-70 factor (ECF subfamily)